MVTNYLGRTVEDIIRNWLRPGRAVLVKGARRTGKTELAKQVSRTFKGTVLWLNGEDIDTQNLLKKRSVRHYQNMLGNTDLLIIDEAQTITDIGKIVKLMVDEVEGLRVLLTGSSSVMLTETAGEPLTGRKVDIDLFPFSVGELRNHYSPVEMFRQRNERVVYGCYPEVLQLNTNKERETWLAEMVRSYLLKDVLMLHELRESEKILRLLQLLAWQIGQEVSTQELGRELSMSKNTAERYLFLLTDAFVIYPLGGYQKNLRKEIVKSRKWYFVDTGIRNAIISDFRDPDFRPDKGALWENFLISERLKYHRSRLNQVKFHFWRTYDRQELDLLESDGHGLSAFEIKWKEPDRWQAPRGFRNAYPDAPVSLIHQDNYMEWL